MYISISVYIYNIYIYIYLHVFIFPLIFFVIFMFLELFYHIQGWLGFVVLKCLTTKFLKPAKISTIRSGLLSINYS